MDPLGVKLEYHHHHQQHRHHQQQPYQKEVDPFPVPPPAGVPCFLAVLLLGCWGVLGVGENNTTNNPERTSSVRQAPIAPTIRALLGSGFRVSLPNKYEGSLKWANNPQVLCCQPTTRPELYTISIASRAFWALPILYL